MSYRVAVNGFGRIGRNYLRCLLERGLLERGVHVVGVNDLWDAGTLAHLLQNDTTFGRLRWDVDHDDANMRVAGASIPDLSGKGSCSAPLGGARSRSRHRGDRSAAHPG